MPILALLTALFAALAGTAAPADAATRSAMTHADTITLLVLDRSGRDDASDTLYLASNTGRWAPDTLASLRIEPAQGERPRAFVFELPRATAADPDFLFKFTRGTWETVETQADGTYHPNRSIVDELAQRRTTETSIELEVFAFADTLPEAPSTVVGTLHTHEIESEALGGARTLRVWLPAGYDDDTDSAYPVLYMHDGQNCFDRATAAFGMEWEIDETLTKLIASGAVPPMIVVGVDNAGPERSWEYNAPDLTFQGRPGYAGRYVDALVDEVMPFVAARYRTKSGPEHTAMGGSSFGGNVTLYALMRRPGVFGQALIESPAVRTVGPRYEDQLLAYEGPWADRVFIAMGTKEYGDAARDGLLAESAAVLADHMKATGVPAAGIRLVIEEGAQHNEEAWSKRFPDAATFLFGD